MSNIPKEKSFWCMIIYPECTINHHHFDCVKRETFTVKRSFHISKAVIDWPYPNDEPCPIVRFMVDCDDKKGIILCELMKNDSCKSLKPEADLDVHFRVGQKITLYSKIFENGVDERPKIHLSGYEFEY